jgi:hypothetical protein
VGGLGVSVKCWVLRGQGGEMTQALYAHMNNKIIFKKVRDKYTPGPNELNGDLLSSPAKTSGTTGSTILQFFLL